VGSQFRTHDMHGCQRMVNIPPCSSREKKKTEVLVSGPEHDLSTRISEQRSTDITEAVYSVLHTLSISCSVQWIIQGLSFGPMPHNFMLGTHGELG